MPAAGARRGRQRAPLGQGPQPFCLHSNLAASPTAEQDLPAHGSEAVLAASQPGCPTCAVPALCPLRPQPKMSEEECKAFVVKAVSHAMARDGSSGGCIRTVVINRRGVFREFIPGGCTNTARRAWRVPCGGLLPRGRCRRHHPPVKSAAGAGSSGGSSWAGGRAGMRLPGCKGKEPWAPPCLGKELWAPPCLQLPRPGLLRPARPTS